MRKFLLLAVSIMFFLPSAFSQENYREGYIVSQNGDTIHGFINYRNWGVNPKRIDFKKTISRQKQVYDPLQIKGFSVKGEHYLSGIIQSATSPRAILTYLSDSSEVVTKTDTAFLRVLVNGEKSLLVFKNEMNIDNFYIMENGKPTLLKYKKYLAEDQNTGHNYLHENKEYVGQLIVYLNDCQKLRSKIYYTEYTNESLTKLFQNYFKCTNQNPEYVQKVEKAKVKFGILAGITESNLHFKTNQAPVLSESNFSSSMDFTGGISIDVIMPRNLHEWSIHNEIAYSSFSSTGNYESSPTAFGYSFIALTDMARFTYSFGSVSLFADAGVSNGIILNFNENYLSTKTNPLINPDVLSKRDFGWEGGVGMDYKKLSFELREDLRNSAVKLEYLGEGCNRISCLLGYNF